MAKNKIKQEKYYSDEQMEIRKFIQILIIIVVLILGVYFFTRIFVSKDLFNKDEEVTKPVAGSIDYNTTIIGSIFNKPEEEYYVLMYDIKNPQAVYYSGLITSYKRNEKSLKVYTVDLNNELNKKYIKDEENLNTKDLNKFAVKNIALLKISKGNIIEASSDIEDIAAKLSYDKDAKK